MAEVDPFDISFADEEKPKKNDRRWNVPDKAFDSVKKMLEQKKKENMTQDAEQIAEQPIDVPEVETSVVDLPPEDENEKEIIVDHNPEEEPAEDGLSEEPNAEDIQLEEPNDNTKEGTVDVTPPNDKTMSDGEPEPEDIEDPSIIENDPDIEDDVVTDKEVGDTRKPNRVEDDDLKDNNKKEEVLSDEEALKEAQELAQDDLEGFRISGKTWSKMTDKQKADAIKAFKDGKKVPPIEDNRTTNNNNYATYERYPTGLRVAEDAGQVIGKGIDLAKEIAEKPLNGTSIDDAVQRAKAIPHYDYTSLFGRR
jgi:hypothetical protein